MTIVGLIPARAGSKRVPGKNIRPLGGKPLIAWTIEAAKEAGIFSEIFVCSDDITTPCTIATEHGVQFVLRHPSSDLESRVNQIINPARVHIVNRVLLTFTVADGSLLNQFLLEPGEDVCRLIKKLGDSAVAFAS